MTRKQFSTLKVGDTLLFLKKHKVVVKSKDMQAELFYTVEHISPPNTGKRFPARSPAQYDLISNIKSKPPTRLSFIGK